MRVALFSDVHANLEALNDPAATLLEPTHANHVAQTEATEKTA